MTEQGILNLIMNDYENKRDIFYLRFFKYMNGVHVVLHGIDHNQHVSKLSGDDSSTVISGMLWPNNVDLIISQVSKLKLGKLKDKTRQ